MRPQAGVNPDALRGSRPKAFDRGRKQRERSIMPEFQGYGCIGKQPRLSGPAQVLLISPESIRPIAFCGLKGIPPRWAVTCLVLPETFFGRHSASAGKPPCHTHQLPVRRSFRNAQPLLLSLAPPSRAVFSWARSSSSPPRQSSPVPPDDRLHRGRGPSAGAARVC